MTPRDSTPRGGMFSRTNRIRPAGLVTAENVANLWWTTAQAKTLRVHPQWDEQPGTHLAPGTEVRLLARTPHWTGSRPGSMQPGEALWLAQTRAGLRGYLRLTNDEAEGEMLQSYMVAFPTEENVTTAALLSALPEDTTPLRGAAPPQTSGGGWGGYALAGTAALLVALGLYYLAEDS